MRLFKVALLLVFFATLPSAADECASGLSELSKTERLASLKSLLKDSRPVGFVNETKGSYFIVEEKNGKFWIGFFTSGFFDLLPIKREGPLLFCDTGQEIRVVGLGRNDVLKIGENDLQLGGGGPIKHFAPGPMPRLLMDLHNIPQRGIASDPQ